MSFRLQHSPAAAAITLDPDRTLLEQLQAAGLQPPFSCRNGSCGRCDARLLSGRVALRNGPLLSEGRVTLCVAYARSDLALALPTQANTSLVRACRWHCRDSGELQLQMPAGRQPQLFPGNHCALLLEHGVVVCALEPVDARHFTVALSSAQVKPIAADQTTLAVLLPLPEAEGRWQLWRRAPDAPAACLWDSADKHSASAALNHYRRQHPRCHWWTQRADCQKTHNA